MNDTAVNSGLGASSSSASGGSWLEETVVGSGSKREPARVSSVSHEFTSPKENTGTYNVQREEENSATRAAHSSWETKSRYS